MLAILAIFIPLMFTFSKSLIDCITDKEECDEKNKIERFIFYNGVYLQCLGYFVIFQLLKIIVSKYQIWINLLYIFIICTYFWVEDFTKSNQEEDKTIILGIFSGFGFIPIVIFTVIWKLNTGEVECLDKLFSFILAMVYLVVWLFIPVWLHPLQNMHKLKKIKP